MKEDKNNVQVNDNEEEIVELTDESGNVLHFYHVATTEYKGKLYAFFQPAENIDGLEEDEVVVLEVNEQDGTLLPILDEKLLDEVYADFIETFDDEDAHDEE